MAGQSDWQGWVLRFAAPLMVACLTCCAPETGSTGDAGALLCGDGFESTTGPACIPLFDHCKESEVALAGGGCKRVGAPSTCLTGWTPVKGGWCEPILPAGKCPSGSMAIIGQATCQPIIDCGSSKYGNIKVTPKTIYVDRHYSKADAAGSKDRPYQSIDEALTAAPAGAHIAVAAGNYEEDLVVNRPVTIDGRCPEMVTVKGYKTDHPGTIQVTASNTVIRGLTVTGTKHGVALFNATGVLIDRCAIVDNASPGVALEQKSELVLRHSLVARNHKVGVGTNDSPIITVDRSVIRDTVEQVDGKLTYAYGLSVFDGPFTVSSSLISDNGAEAGVIISGSTGKVLRSVIRRNRDRPKVAGFTSSGLRIQNGADVIIQDTLIAQNRTAGVIVGNATVRVERTVIRDTRPASQDGLLGLGVLIIGKHGHPASRLIMKDSTVARSAGLGAHAIGGDVTFERVIFSGGGTRRGKNELVGGLGTHGESTGAKDTIRKLTLEATNCLFEDNIYYGLHASSNTEVSVKECTFRATHKSPWWKNVDTNIGVGLWAQRKTSHPGKSPVVKVTGSLFERTEGPGLMVLFGGEVTMERTLVRDTTSIEGLAIPAITAQTVKNLKGQTLPSVTLRCSGIDNTPGVGLSLIGAGARLEQVAVRNTSKPGGDGVHVGDDEIFPSTINMDCSLVKKSARAGLIIFGSKGKICRSIFRGGTYAIVLEEGAAPTICDNNRYENNQRTGVAFGQNLKPAPVAGIPKGFKLPKLPEDGKQVGSAGR